MKRFVVIFLIAGVLAAVVWLAAWLPVREARAAWRAGADGQAIAIAQRWLPLHIRAEEYHQLLAAAYLTSGNRAAAARHLDAIRNASIWFPAVPKEEVARRLFAIGDFDGFLSYDAASHEPRDRAEVLLYRAAALLASDRVREANLAFRAINSNAVDPKHYRALAAAIANRGRGMMPWVFDRAGEPIAAWDVAGNRVAATDPTFAPLVESTAGALTFGSQANTLGTKNTIETTLDPVVQNAALAALGSYRGGFVAIDPRTNEILAIASTAGKGTPSNIALESQYEPGSVVKIVTGLNAIESGVDLKSLFPYDCKGFLDIDGRRFADWVPNGHGKLASIDEAFAVSCNIVFADVGLRLGAGKIRSSMVASGFNDETDLGVFKVPLGRIIEPVPDRFETAFLAIGLKHETTTAMHLAMIASMMANRGMLTTPRLMRSRHSLLGDPAAGPAPQPSARIATVAAAETMIRAMQAVVTDPRGTGRRGEIPGVSMALKTGTSGSAKDHALNAVIVGFAPVESPKIAFAVIAEDAGPAEYAGAKIAHDFVAGLKSRGLL